MITIYGDPISGNCLKVKWTCERLAIPFTWIDVNVVKRETRSDAFLAMNPAGQAPTIVLEDGRPLAQSGAIILYLAEGSPLIPADPYLRAKMLEWMFWEQYNHEPTVAVVRYQMKYLGRPRSELDPALIAKAQAALSLLDRALTDAALAGRDFLVGETSDAGRHRPGRLHPLRRRWRLRPGRHSVRRGLGAAGRARASD